MPAFSQDAWTCRCEWGPAAVTALESADVTVVIDVFSFTTCVDVAVSRGAAILPHPWNDASAPEFAKTHGAELAGRRRQARYSLAPASYLDAPAGLRCVLPSPNGAGVCGSGRELEERGHEQDKAIAGQLDVSSCVPRFNGLAFVAA